LYVGRMNMMDTYASAFQYWYPSIIPVVRRGVRVVR
jgi:hypothetical protein